MTQLLVYQVCREYFVNEIESDIAGLYINFPNIKFPALEVLANTYVQKAYELVN